MKINYFSRKREPQFNSIEELFDVIIKSFPPDITVEYYEVPYKGASLPAILGNTCYALFHRGNINHITGHIKYIAPALGRNTVLTVHDIKSSLNGRFPRDFFIKLLWYRIPALCAKHITVISEFTKKELLEIIPFAAKKITVIPDPANNRLRPHKQRFNSECPRILHIGTKPNKNLERTIEALYGIPCKLAVIGILTKKQQSLLKDSEILFENYFDIPYDDIITQYERSDIVSFASLYEGFGMPVIEANAVGRPVLAGNSSAIPETAGNAACLVDATDVTSIRNGFLKIIRQEDYRNELVINGFENIKRFSPEIIAEQYIELYRKLRENRE